nr:immunoglobulin heavy chain junction region [Macaca mulatta]MOW21714.1 immunoglobulin heavy chain junction region [Macaca mulatta]
CARAAYWGDSFDYW